jgi:crooked neck
LQRVILLESWKDFEENHGTEETLETVMSKMPRTVKRSKKRKTEEGADNVVYEEYYDYIFPDDETQKPNIKLLQMANAWAQAQAQAKKTNDSAEQTEE